jgi:predicted nucleic acid-binding protein
VAAVDKIDNLRRNPAWMVLDYPGPGLMEKVWAAARSSDSARRIYDIRLGLTLRHYGVRRFATASSKDFRGLGFEKVWNPLG